MRVERVVAAVLSQTGEQWREVATGEWGLTLADVGGAPLHVGVALRAGLLRVQAEVLWPGALEPADLLRRNRRTVLVRFTQTAAGSVCLQGELPLSAALEPELDRLLGLLVESAADARYAARRIARSR